MSWGIRVIRLHFGNLGSICHVLPISAQLQQSDPVRCILGPSRQTLVAFMDFWPLWNELLAPDLMSGLKKAAAKNHVFYFAPSLPRHPLRTQMLRYLTPRIAARAHGTLDPPCSKGGSAPLCPASLFPPPVAGNSTATSSDARAGTSSVRLPPSERVWRLACPPDLQVDVSGQWPRPCLRSLDVACLSHARTLTRGDQEPWAPPA